MDWKISELKYNARTILKTCYWKTVFVALILAVATGTVNVGSSSRGTSNLSDDDLDFLKDKIESYIGDDYDDYDYEGYEDDSYYYDDFDYSDLSYKEEYKASNVSFFDDPADVAMISTILILVGVVVLIGVVIGGAVTYLVFKPLEVGCKKYMVNADTGKGVIDDVIVNFKNGVWGKTCLVMFLRGMYIGLWSLLFIIPGIIKNFEYRMVPYILADHPDWSREDIFEMSKTMMNGNKWRAFLLDLSFIGWRILAIFTLGLLNVFYVNPYSDLTCAQLYITLKMKFDPDEIYEEKHSFDAASIAGQIG